MRKAINSAAETLLEIANHEVSTRKLTYQHLLEMLGNRAFGVVLLFFALPSAMPFSAIPGVSVIFSVPILIFACQMIVARKTLWLPKAIANRTVNHKTISKVIHTTVPYLVKMEYFLKPRWTFMDNRFMEILNGAMIFCLALLLMLPIPFSNFIFGGLLIIFSLGLIAKDGLFILIGHLISIFYISFISILIMKALKHLFS